MSCITEEREEAAFRQADRKIAQAASRIEGVVKSLLSAQLPFIVAEQYVIERLFAELIERNPEMMDWLNEQHGDASMRLANALMDWRDHPSKR